MRKIDKTKILSVEYKKWLDKLNRDKMNHPQSGIYHDDVVRRRSLPKEKNELTNDGN